MRIIIRIRGLVGINKDTKETFNRLRLRRKYSCVIFPKTSKEQEGMLRKVKDSVAYGEIEPEMFEKLVEARGQLIDKNKKMDVKKTFKSLIKGKKYSELNLKPFFRLHPPRGGINSKKHFGKEKGILGDNGKEINKLLERML
jgi:large subunit ribosomal protein L30